MWNGCLTTVLRSNSSGADHREREEGGGWSSTEVVSRDLVGMTNCTGNLYLELVYMAAILHLLKAL